MLKGGEPDVPNISRMILNDWQRGKLPFYCHPPELPGRTEKQEQQSQYVIEQDFSKIRVIPEFPGEENLLQPEPSIPKEFIPQEPTVVQEDESSTSSSDEFSDEEQEQKLSKPDILQNLTSKERRKIIRQNRRHKVGSNFYEVVNVKNRKR